MRDITYSVNRYDKDGDIFESCVLINLQNGVILDFKSVEDLDIFIKELKECSKQIKLCN